MAALLSGQAIASKEARRFALYDMCMNRSGGVTSAMKACVLQEMPRRRAALKSAYDATLARLPGVEASALRRRERTWFDSIPKQCDIAMQDEDQDGTLYGVMYPACFLDKLDEGRAWLEAYRSEPRTTPRPQPALARAKVDDILITQRYPAERREALRLLAAEHRAGGN